jgi:hypothetical protein
MSEKYYVVSEEELDNLFTADTVSEHFAMDAACRARPVRFISAHDEVSSLMLWGEDI